MKWVVKIILFIFIVFLFKPTIVSLIRKSADMSFFYDMSAEELTHKEIKTEFIFEPVLMAFLIFSQTSGVIHSGNLLKHNNITSTIFIPPPESKLNTSLSF